MITLLFIWCYTYCSKYGYCYVRHAKLTLRCQLIKGREIIKCAKISKQILRSPSGQNMWLYFISVCVVFLRICLISLIKAIVALFFLHKFHSHVIGKGFKDLAFVFQVSSWWGFPLFVPYPLPESTLVPYLKAGCYNWFGDLHERFFQTCAITFHQDVATIARWSATQCFIMKRVGWLNIARYMPIVFQCLTFIG